MGKYKQIVELLSQSFKCQYQDFFKRGEMVDFRGEMVDFACENKSKCEVKESEPIWSPAFGTEGTKVMIVAEAPSAAEGKGPFSGGLVKQWTKKIEPYYYALFQFVEEYYSTPYFTDLVKCGVSKQTKEMKKSLKKRISNCVERFLLREIAIIHPRDILCLGKESYCTLKKLQNEGKIKRNIKLFQLIHCSNQARLTLSLQDKENVIWPFQITGEKKGELSFFKQKGASPHKGCN
ncbi:MAG TPA: uracil-DNA glycosylase family protein [Candidatus Hypogeohydataceae bacterium YC41]